jgi:Lrp/AsnC family leucine-responsive transcriptional regulator
MAKSSYEQIKKDEKKIIEEMEKNARYSIDEIAKNCGFSRQKVWRLIKRLEGQKIIWGYHAVADHEKLGSKEYIILIKRSLKNIDKLVDIIISREIEEGAKKLNAKISSSYYLNGHYDWIICLIAEDIKAAKKFSETLNKTYGEYIKESQLLENIFPVKRCGLINPNIKQLKEFL